MHDTDPIPFRGMPKIARLARECVVTEKIDGTNASVYVPEDAGPLLFGSRTRWITPESDNHGFARWGREHESALRGLGPGHHFGEWWGLGINRGYGLDHKRFSLFNVGGWTGLLDGSPAPHCCHVVPVLARGIFGNPGWAVGDIAGIWDQALDTLQITGSVAAPGFMRPEGVVVWHEAARIYFKKTLENDEGKG